jgi:hypothetical protein
MFKKAYSIQEGLLDRITCMGTLSQRKWDPQYRNVVRTCRNSRNSRSTLRKEEKDDSHFNLGRKA